MRKGACNTCTAQEILQRQGVATTGSVTAVATLSYPLGL